MLRLHLHTELCSSLQIQLLAISSVIILLCMQVLALFAGQPYDRHLQELQNLDAHLTNTCRHARTDVEKEDAVHLLSELPQVNSQTPGVHLSYMPPHMYVYVYVCTCIYICIHLRMCSIIFKYIQYVT